MKALLLLCWWLPFGVLSQQVNVTIFRDGALDCDWNPANANEVCYSVKGPDTYYDIHIASPDRSHDTCITCDHPDLPNRHISNASWHPSGKWLLLVVEKKEHPRGSVNALPGFGAYCDLYLISSDGKRSFLLYETPNDFDHGIIAPRFSPDGTQIVWTDRFRRPAPWNAQRHFGFWTIKTAAFTFGKDSIPVLSNPRDLLPGKRCFNDSYGFSPDGKQLILCSSMTTHSAWKSQLFVMNADGTGIRQLTSGKAYNEHGCYSPDGKIVWMSNSGNKNKGTDWWIMNADGTDQHRLTFFNDPKHPQYTGKAVWTGLASFSPVGNRFIGGIQKSLITQEGYIVIVELLPVD
jgi:hypothetical protein